MNSCRQPGRHPTRNCNKLSFLVFLENIPVYSEARLNKRVNCVLLGVGGAWCIIAFKSMRCPSADTLCPFGGYSLWDHEGNSSSHSISERYTLTPPYASRSTVFSVFVCFRLASSVSWTPTTVNIFSICRPLSLSPRLIIMAMLARLARVRHWGLRKQFDCCAGERRFGLGLGERAASRGESAGVGK